MIEYIFDTTLGAFRLSTDSEHFYIEKPKSGAIYDEGFDLIVLYLETRNDSYAKSLIEGYITYKLNEIKDILNKVKEAEVEIEKYAR